RAGRTEPERGVLARDAVAPQAHVRALVAPERQSFLVVAHELDPRLRREREHPHERQGHGRARAERARIHFRDGRVPVSAAHDGPYFLARRPLPGTARTGVLSRTLGPLPSKKLPGSPEVPLAEDESQADTHPVYVIEQIPVAGAHEISPKEIKAE